MSSWDSPQYTCDYSQPESYHFSLDSILLAKAAVRDYKATQVPPDFQVLDLCAGAGVVGLELAHLSRKFKNIDFIEIQEAYKTHFEINARKAKDLNLKTQFFLMNYKEMQTENFKDRYDLILCNPPYFEKERGLIPPNSLKARSRFFLDATLEDLCQSLIHSLKPKGKAYLLTRNQSDHGTNRQSQLKSIFQDKATLSPPENLRGTDLNQIQKP